MEIVEERYLKWVTGLDNCMPVYMVGKELQRNKLKRRAEKRAW